MKTSKEMQLKIIDKMRENIVEGNKLLTDVEYYSGGFGEWREVKQITEDSFEIYKHRVRPETIKVDGVEIPKPLNHDELDDSIDYFHVWNDKHLYDCSPGRFIKHHGINFVYETAEEAIEASKLLFGIE